MRAVRENLLDDMSPDQFRRELTRIAGGLEPPPDDAPSGDFYSWFIAATLVVFGRDGNDKRAALQHAIAWLSMQSDFEKQIRPCLVEVLGWQLSDAEITAARAAYDQHRAVEVLIS